MRSSLAGILLVVLLASCLCLGQDATAASRSGQEQASPAVPGTLLIELSKSLDANKLKAGDEVLARTASDGRAPDGSLIPRGSQVTGHITEAKARKKGDSESSLGIAFDKVVARDGHSMPLQAVIQAVGPSPAAAAMAAKQGLPSPMGASPSLGSPSGSGPMGTNTVGSMPGASPAPGAPGGFGAPPASPPRTSGASAAATPLSPQSTGVRGIPNLQLQPNSVLVSAGKDLKLEGGTQMVLKVQNQ